MSQKRKRDKTPSAEIIPAESGEIVKYGASGQLRWVNVAYNTAVYIRQVSSLSGATPVADHIFGRCMGERSDGKTYFASIIIPWVQDEGYDWKPSARKRLDSFLLPECECDARYDETKVCLFHVDLMAEWDGEDRRGMRIGDAQRMPPVQEGAGIFPESKEMHKLYPWVREMKKDGRYVCMICGFGKEQGGAIGNPTYRNIFIRDHSHCGFGDPKRYAPPEVETPQERMVRDPVYFLEQKTKEFLDPSTPTPGHAEGCVCHRCRIAAENKAKTIDAGVQIERVQDLHPIDKMLLEANNTKLSCRNCRKPLYVVDGVLYHMDRFRACHWSGLKLAEAA